MAIKTVLADEELAAVAAGWRLGRLDRSRGLPEGSINTLYVLETASGRYVLRLSEGRREAEVRFETDLVRHLDASRYPAVRLVPRPDGAPWGLVRGKFACVFRWGAGEHLVPRETTPAQAMDSGRLLARLHVLGESFPGQLENRYGVGPIRALVATVGAKATAPARPSDPELRAALPLLEREALALDRLPSANEGVIHADWFPDNLLFLGDRVATVLDFEMACRGPCVLDLATAVHAGCWDDDFSVPRVRALVAGYQEERRLGADERAAFHAYARFSALRFTVTRILDFHLAPLAADRLHRKDWRRFRDRLQRTVELGPRGWADMCGL